MMNGAIAVGWDDYYELSDCRKLGILSGEIV